MVRGYWRIEIGNWKLDRRMKTDKKYKAQNRRHSVCIGILCMLLAIQSCKREDIPPFTIHVYNAYDFDITLFGSANRCDYGEDRETNPLCRLRAGEQRAYETYGPGRPFTITTYKTGTKQEVGSLYYVGKSGKHYRWEVGEDNPVVEIPERR